MQQPTFYVPALGNYGFDALGLPLPQPSHLSQSSQTDLNSPEVFKQNIQLVQSHVARVQAVAQSALAGMFVCRRPSSLHLAFDAFTDSSCRQHAYQPGTNPVQTAGTQPISCLALSGIISLLTSRVILQRTSPH